MTVEEEALALVNEDRRRDGLDDLETAWAARHGYRYAFYALCWQIEAKRALQATLDEREKADAKFRQEVSDAVEAYMHDPHSVTGPQTVRHLSRFIIAKPDPLVDALIKGGIVNHSAAEMAADIRAAIEKRGGKIIFN